VCTLRTTDIFAERIGDLATTQNRSYSKIRIGVLIPDGPIEFSCHLSQRILKRHLGYRCSQARPWSIKLFAHSMTASLDSLARHWRRDEALLVSNSLRCPSIGAIKRASS
jgi:hypothetical protein